MLAHKTMMLTADIDFSKLNLVVFSLIVFFQLMRLMCTFSKKVIFNHLSVFPT